MDAVLRFFLWHCCFLGTEPVCSVGDYGRPSHSVRSIDQPTSCPPFLYPTFDNVCISGFSTQRWYLSQKMCLIVPMTSHIGFLHFFGDVWTITAFDKKQEIILASTTCHPLRDANSHNREYFFNIMKMSFKHCLKIESPSPLFHELAHYQSC